MPRNAVGTDDLRADLPVFDRDVSLGLGGMIGHQRLRRMTATFILDAEARMAAMAEVATTDDLAEHMHALVSMAGHLGFTRLSALCRDIQEHARDGGGLEHRPALRGALKDARDAAADMLSDDGARGGMGAELPTVRDNSASSSLAASA